jgi:hypothetical protein
MKRAVLVLVLVALAGCGQKTASDQVKEEKMLGSALATASTYGQHFTMSETIKVTGSGVSVPKQAQFQAEGLVKEGDVQMVLQITNAQQPSVFDFLIVDEQLYVKADNANRWRTMPADSANNVYPAIRLQLLREAVLLASSESGPSVEHVTGGFAHKYVVKPSGDQLEQLETVDVNGDAETAFLKSAKGEIDVFISTSGNRLMRTEVHLTGADQGGTKQQIDATADFNPDARARPVLAPTDAVAAPPGQIFSATEPAAQS